MLKERIQDKSAIIGVIGLGYVGLPLAVEKAKAGYKVIGFDIQESKVQMVNEGHNYIGDVVNADLEKIVSDGHSWATSDFDELSGCDVIAICVPTPLDVLPAGSYVRDQLNRKCVAKRLHKDMLVVLESTTYPGTTEDVMKPILEETGLICGKRLLLGLQPRKSRPGKPQIQDEEHTESRRRSRPRIDRRVKLFVRICLGRRSFVVSSPKEAEMTKILENTFRIVNIAPINEMAVVADKMGINIWDVINAASTKPSGFMPFFPGP